MTATVAGEELVVLLDDRRRPVGTAPKADVHTTDTPLHLAFSCYVFNERAELLVTRRARTKRTFPGVRTNTCCGHPGPGETMDAAVRRRLGQELGMAVISVDLILPAFRYRATAVDGTVENELCPVYRAVAVGTPPDPDPDEVDAAWWQPWADFCAEVGGDDPLSWWGARQVQQLLQLGADPFGWPVADPAGLPSAAVAPAPPG